MSRSAADILARLRDEPAQLDALITLAVDHVLDQPLAALVDQTWLAEAISAGVRATAEADGFETWLAARVEQALARADARAGTLADEIPVTLLGPLEQALRRPYQPNRELTRALLDHPSTRKILREILEANLLEFGKRMRAMMPDAGKLPGGGLASRFATVARGVASAVSTELEKQLEPKVNSFVEDMLGVTIDGLVERVSSEGFAPEFAAFRVDVLHAMLAQPIERLAAERHKYPPADLAADLGAMLRAIAAWRGLDERVAELVAELFEAHGQTSARAYLDGSGLIAAWRPQVEGALREPARELVRSEAFASWLEALVED